jgi:hypothetical protein
MLAAVTKNMAVIKKIRGSYERVKIALYLLSIKKV